MTRERYEQILFAHVPDEVVQDMLNQYVLELEAENAKLRELVQDMHGYFHLTKVQGLCQWGPSIMRRIRDLEIEVEE